MCPTADDHKAIREEAQHCVKTAAGLHAIAETELAMTEAFKPKAFNGATVKGLLKSGLFGHCV